MSVNAELPSVKPRNTIMLVGGGTGGHITPNLAVAQQLKQLDPDCHLLYVLEKHSKFSHLLEESSELDQVFTVSAGKFRRYYGESWLIRLFDIKTNMLNIRDSFRVVKGLIEAWQLLRRVRPDVVFIKGSLAGLPIGLAAAGLHIPFVTHDSDSLPGLANRLLGRWATVHATGMPVEFYNYPPAQTVYVGVPLTAQYQLVSEEQQRQYRKQLEINPDSKILLVAGGSNGAEKINQAVALIAQRLLDQYKDLSIVHQVGRGQLKTYVSQPESDRLIVAEFFAPEDMIRYSGAADLIVARAGATTIAEFAAQAKACIIVPNPMLAGGHQLKNAEHLAEQGAIEIYPEVDLSRPEGLADRIADLLDHPKERQLLAQRLGALARPQAAKDIAQILIRVAAGETVSAGA